MKGFVSKETVVLHKFRFWQITMNVTVPLMHTRERHLSDITTASAISDEGLVIEKSTFQSF